MRILTTGIGCVGKSSLRERLNSDFPNDVTSVGTDYDREVPSDANKAAIVESIHRLEKDPQMFDKILYLLPLGQHPILWLRRTRAWFSMRIVDLSAPKGKRKRFAVSNVPIILQILVRNVLLRRKWIDADPTRVREQVDDKTRVARSASQGYHVISTWIMNYTSSGHLNKGLGAQ